MTRRTSSKFSSISYQTGLAIYTVLTRLIIRTNFTKHDPNKLQLGNFSKSVRKLSKWTCVLRLIRTFLAFVHCLDKRDPTVYVPLELSVEVEER